MMREPVTVKAAAPSAAPSAALHGPAGKHVVISSFDSPGNPHYNGGGAVVVDMLARSLARDFRVTIVTVGRQRREVMRNEVRYVELPLGWAGPRGGQLLFHLVLPFAARRIRHHLWIESFTPPFSTSFLPVFSPARVAGFAQTLSGAEMWTRYRLPFFLIERLGLRFYRDVIVVNPADGARVRHCNPSAVVQVIPNCIDLPEQDQGLPGRGEHILYLGRIDLQVKGLDLLLAAYERSGVDIPLLLAGTGTPGEERKLARLLEATARDVRWVGYVTGDRKQQLLRASAVVVLPSRHESFGIAALEGMSYCKPVIHFDLPTLRWMDGDVRVAPFDVSAFAAAIRELAGDEETRRKLGLEARAAAQRYGREETAKRYLSLVGRLLETSEVNRRPERDPSCQ